MCAEKEKGGLFSKILSKHDKQKTKKTPEYITDESQIENASAEEIISLIDNPSVTVVSFDVFDTLLVRPGLRPTDILKLLRIGTYSGSESSRMRWFADSRCYERMGASETLSDIYTELGSVFGVSKEDLKKSYDSELKLEMDLIRPNEKAKALYDKAKELGKKIIIISDTYFERSYLEELLVHNGYTGYSKIYCSTETLLRKDSSEVFEPVCKDLEVNPANIIHIGDNFYSDYNGPLSHGWKACVCMRPSMQFGRSKISRYMPYMERRFDNDILWGTYANYFMNHSRSGKTFGSAYDLGLFMGPTLLNFAVWIMTRMRYNHHNHLLLCYRDGYLIEKIFDEISNHTKVGFTYEEIHLPRILRHVFYSENGGLFRSLEEMGLSPQMTVTDFIRYRLYTETPEDTEEALNLFRELGYSGGSDPIGSVERIYPILPRLDKIFERSSSGLKQLVRNYCRSKTSKDGTAVFDIGYRGSILLFLENTIGIESFEYQMMANSGMDLRQFGSNIESYLTYSRKAQMDVPFMEMLMENIISSQEPELLGLADSVSGISYVFGTPIPSSEEIEDVQRGILDYIRYTSEILKDRLMELILDRTFEFSMLQDILASHEPDLDKLIDKLKRPDSSQICGTPIKPSEMDSS